MYYHMDRQFLLKERKKMLQEEMGKQKAQQMFFQERDYHALDQLKYQLIDSFIQLTQQHYQSSIFTSLLHNYRNHITSLLTFKQSILQHLHDFTFFTLSHRHHTAQGILMALLLCKQPNKKVILITSKNKMARNCQIFGVEEEVDTVSYVQNCLTQEGIQLVDLREPTLDTLNISEKHIVVVDLFNIEPPQYYLQLDKELNTLKKAYKLFIYHSSYQEADVRHLLKTIQQKQQPLNWLHLDLAPSHPIQSKSYTDSTQILNAIIEFLQSISCYAEKLDIIIYYPLDQPLYKYIRKLKEMMVKASLKDSINLISDNHQTPSKVKSNIFMVSRSSQLQQWKYNYSRVFMVVDYGQEEAFIYDYQFDCYIEKISYQSPIEKCKRMMWVGSDRCGSYHYLNQHITSNSTFWSNYKDISAFIVTAIHHSQLHLINQSHPRVKKCINYLQQAGIVQSSQKNGYKVTDPRYLHYAIKGLSPIQTKLILSVADDHLLSDKSKQKYMNLIVIVVAIQKNKGNLRKIKQQLEGGFIKPYAVWRKSGYIESCIQIITKCQLIQSRKHTRNSKSQQFRKKTSKSKGNYDLFSKQSKRKKNFEEMEITDLIVDYTVDEELMHLIRDEVDYLRFIFEFEMLPILIDKESINKMMWYLTKFGLRTSISVYTGSKNIEYFNGKHHMSMSQTCLFHILNQRPQLLKIVRLSEINGTIKITMANSVAKQTYTQIFGAIPTIQRIHIKQQTQKHAQQGQVTVPEVAKQFSFENIPSAVLQYFIKDNGVAIQQFQYENNCYLILLVQNGRIEVSCFKDEIQNKNYVRENLKVILKKQIDICTFYTKKVHYMGIVNLIVGEGGKMIEIGDSVQISRCLVRKLPPEIARQYLQIVLEDFAIKSIEMVEPDQYEALPSAIVEFYSQKAFQEFLSHYHQHMSTQNLFTMEPLKDSDYCRIQKKQEQNFKFDSINTTIMFQWYTWKSHCKAQVKFKTSQSVTNTIEAFTANPLLDLSPIKIDTDPQNPCIINIDNLNPHTDQIYIAEALKDYGKIQSVQILKTPLKETLGDAEHIGHLIKVAAKRNDIVKYKILSIEKKECGLRVAKVAIQDVSLTNIICDGLNKRTGFFGEGRLYVQPIFQRQILIPEGCLEIYTEFFQELLVSLEKDEPKIRTQIREENQNLYFVFQSPIEQTLLFVLSRFKQQLNGVKIDFPLQAQKVIMNQIGVANLLDLEQKHSCKFIISVYSNKIKVLANKEQLSAILHEVQQRLHKHFFYKITLTSKVYKYYQTHPQILTQLQTQFDLILTQLEEDNWALLLEGSAVNIQRALVWMHQKDKARLQQIPQGNNLNLCGICGQPLQDSYRLICQHRFCKQCLLDYLKYSLSDMSLFPLKCPESKCRKPVSCMDLQHLLDSSDWYRMRSLIVNDFLKTNEHFIYCLTPGCEQVNCIQKTKMDGVQAQFIRCDICKNNYCVKCNESYHPARTCKEAKMSQDELLTNYIKDKNVRKCVGARCKVLVQRYAGCFKVQCSRCSTVMCFKCPPEEMVPYSTPQECYWHLNAVHGGYF